MVTRDTLSDFIYTYTIMWETEELKEESQVKNTTALGSSKITEGTL